MVTYLTKKNGSIFFLSLISFLIPLHQKLSTVTIVIFVFTALLWFKKITFKREFLILVLLYLVYILFDVLNAGRLHVKVIEMKSSLVVFSFIFSVIDYHYIAIRKAYRGFILGCFVALMICYGYALYRSVDLSDGVWSFSALLPDNSADGLFLSSVREGSYFFGSHFSIFHQTVYFAMYLNIAVVLLLYYGFFSKWIRIFLLVFFCIALFQISNRINLLIPLFSFTAYSFFLIRNKWYKGFMVLFVLIIGLGIITANPRVKQVYVQLTTDQIHLDREANNSLETRLLIWDASLPLIGENLIDGVGVTHAYEALKSSYKTKRYVIPYRHRLNAHNQFLQITIECGIIGFFILIAQLVVLSFTRKSFPFLTVGILFVFLINFLFESVLNRYSGIVCYAFFYCLLSLSHRNISKKKGRLAIHKTG